MYLFFLKVYKFNANYAIKFHKWLRKKKIAVRLSKDCFLKYEENW